jgi:hypothetical protein
MTTVTIIMPNQFSEQRAGIQALLTAVRAVSGVTVRAGEDLRGPCEEHCCEFPADYTAQRAEEIVTRYAQACGVRLDSIVVWDDQA